MTGADVGKFADEVVRIGAKPLNARRSLLKYISPQLVPPTSAYSHSSAASEFRRQSMSQPFNGRNANTRDDPRVLASPSQTASPQNARQAAAACFQFRNSRIPPRVSENIIHFRRHLLRRIETLKHVLCAGVVVRRDPDDAEVFVAHAARIAGSSNIASSSMFWTPMSTPRTWEHFSGIHKYARRCGSLPARTENCHSAVTRR